MKRDRILLIHRAIAPYRIELLNKIYARLRPHIIMEYPNALEQHFGKETIGQRISFPYEVLPISFRRLPNLRLSLIPMILRGRYEVVVCSEYNLITLMVYLLRFLTLSRYKIVVICDDHERLAEETIARGSRLKRFLLRRTDLLITCDERTATAYTRSYQTPCINMPIIQDERVLRQRLQQALPRAEELLRAYIDSTYHKILLYVGRLSEEKDLPTLLHAFALMRERGIKDTKLVMVGNGIEQSPLQDLAKELGIEEAIHFAGKCEGEDLYAHYLIATLQVLTSKFERFGAVVNEGLVAGVPQICTAIAGASNMIGEKQGVVIAPQQPTRLAEVIGHQLSLCQPLPVPLSLRPSLMPYSFEEKSEELLKRLESLRHPSDTKP